MLLSLLGSNASPCGERISKYDFAVALAKAFSYDHRIVNPIKYSQHPNSALRPRDMSLSNKKVTKVLQLEQTCLSDQILLLSNQSQTGLKDALQSL